MTGRLGSFYLVYFAVIGAFLPYWSLYLEDQGFDKRAIGILTALTMLTRMLAPMVWGWLADRSGRHMRWVRLATFMEAVACCLLLWRPDQLWQMGLLMLFFSFFQNAVIAQFEAVTLFHLGERRQQYGRIRLWGSVGFLLCAMTVGFGLDIYSIQVLPYILMGLCILAWLLSWLIPEPVKADRSLQQVAPLWPALRKSAVWRFFVLELILLFSHAPFYGFYSNYLKEHGFSTGQIGMLWATGVIAEVIMLIWADRWLKRARTVTWLRLIVVLTALRWLLVSSFADSLLWQWLAQTLHAFSFALFHVIAMRLIFSQFMPEQQGRAQAGYVMVWGIGVGVGTLLAGQFWNQLGGSLLFLIAAVSALTGLLLIRFRQDPLVSDNRMHPATVTS